jgi:glycosyltransferase involved in cell wall biosynthesis
MIIGANVRLLTGSHLEGVARYALETIKHMALMHPENHWILFFDRKNDTDYAFPPNVTKVILYPQARHPILWRYFFDISLTRALRRYKVDVLYSPDGYTSLTTKIPSVMVLHDLAYAHFPEFHSFTRLWDYKTFTPKYLRKANKIITVSHFVSDDIIDLFPDLGSKISVAYNAYKKPEIFDDSKKCIEIAEPYFLYIGSLNPRKNIDRLIDAFHIFNENTGQKYRLVLAGKIMSLPKKVRHKINTTANVIYLGPIDEQNKHHLIRKAFAMTYVSVFEGFGIPILEAFAFETPIITSKTSSMPEVAGQAAILVDPFNVHNIAEGMHKLHSDKAYRDFLKAEGTKRLMDFDWQKSAEIIYKEIENVYINKFT